jgi:hypothetical protein
MQIVGLSCESFSAHGDYTAHAANHCRAWAQKTIRGYGSR